jgi:hypothetical protein
MNQGRTEDQNIAQGFEQTFPRSRLYRITIINTGIEVISTASSGCKWLGESIVHRIKFERKLKTTIDKQLDKSKFKKTNQREKRRSISGQFYLDVCG